MWTNTYYYSAIMWDRRPFLVIYCMSVYGIYMRYFPHTEIMAVSCVHVDMYRSSSIKFQCQYCLIGFYFTESFVLIVFYHWYGHTLDCNIVGYVTTVNLLVNQMTYFIISTGGCNGQYWKFAVICLSQSWHIISWCSRTSTTNYHRFTCFCGHSASKIGGTTFVNGWPNMEPRVILDADHKGHVGSSWGYYYPMDTMRFQQSYYYLNITFVCIESFLFHNIISILH